MVAIRGLIRHGDPATASVMGFFSGVAREISNVLGGFLDP